MMRITVTVTAVSQSVRHSESVSESHDVMIHMASHQPDGHHCLTAASREYHYSPLRCVIYIQHHRTACVHTVIDDRADNTIPTLNVDDHVRRVVVPPHDGVHK